MQIIAGSQLLNHIVRDTYIGPPMTQMQDRYAHQRKAVVFLREPQRLRLPEIIAPQLIRLFVHIADKPGPL